jgi:hypothetical protein
MRERLLGCLRGSEKGADGMAFRIYLERIENINVPY